MKRDYYDILSIDKTAGEKEIKRAYKKLAMKYHPDRNQGDKQAEKKFKEIKEAYEVLIDKEKRTAYDRYGHNAFENNSYNAHFNDGFSQTSDFSEIFGDVFGDIFGKRRKKKRGSDLQYEISLTLEEAVCGLTKKICIPSFEKCNVCGGNGAKAGTYPETCYSCKGLGQIHMRQGFFSVQQTCVSCQGKGHIIREVCIECQGYGRRRIKKTLSVKIPAGINDSDQIRLNGEGELGEFGSSPGDLYVKIRVIRHDIFRREENDLHCEIPIDFFTATLGGEISVPTLNGKVSIKIPKETQTGKVFRIKGKGIKSIRNKSIGDLFFHIVIETPINLSDKQKNILRLFHNSLTQEKGNKNRPKSEKFLRRVKNFFKNLKKKSL